MEIKLQKKTKQTPSIPQFTSSPGVQAFSSHENLGDALLNSFLFELCLLKPEQEIFFHQ